MQKSCQSRPTRILIIDDDPLIRTLLVSALRKECLVAAAAEGSEGFHKALDLKPDVVVIDVNMPGWDGLMTLEAFRAHPTLKDVKVIMLTADASRQTVMAAIRGGANDYLIKTNFSKADFGRKLNRLVPGTISEWCPAGDPAAESSGRSDPCSRPHPARQAVSQQEGEVGSVPAAGTACAEELAECGRLQELIDGWE
jgi:CheY-like chemotaxis protein